MATWLTHLRIARILGGEDELSCLDLPRFYLGNIAPDSGEPCEGGYMPSKVISHFGHSVSREYDRFIREYMSGRDDGNYSFMLGYFVHLLADGIWVTTELEELKDEFAGDFPSKEAFYSELKKDLYTADREFIAMYGFFDPVCAIANSDSFENTIFPFFSRDAFEKQARRVVSSMEFMNEIKNTPCVYRYILPERIDKYIESAAAAIMEKLRFYGLTGKN